MPDQRIPQLLMRLKSLAHLPPINLPLGYVLRSFQEGDGVAWESVIGNSFGGTHNFEKDMASSAYFHPDRVKFICYDGEPIATASAWATSDGTGYLHMVGVHGDHLGQGLGGQVSLAALHQMVVEGRTRAILNTDDFRIPAIRTYLKLGFIPEMAHENHLRRWVNVLRDIGREDMILTLQDEYGNR